MRVWVIVVVVFQSERDVTHAPRKVSRVVVLPLGPPIFRGTLVGSLVCACACVFMVRRGVCRQWAHTKAPRPLLFLRRRVVFAAESKRTQRSLAMGCIRCLSERRPSRGSSINRSIDPPCNQKPLLQSHSVRFLPTQSIDPTTHANNCQTLGPPQEADMRARLRTHDTPFRRGRAGTPN